VVGCPVVAGAGLAHKSARLAAWLLVAVAVLAVVGELVPAYPDWVTGVLGWMACVLFWPRLKTAQRRVALLLVVFGAAGIVWATLRGHGGLVNRALTQNMPLVGMLIAVSFLQLISTSHSAADEPPSVGRYALLSTLIGLHLFGAVINFSAVVIFADRLAARAKLSIDQATGLSQTFISGAIWSPFYGAMAVALTLAPTASLTRMLCIGIPLAAIGILITWLTLSSKRHDYARNFVGYPLHLEALWVPLVLSLSVLALHELKPGWSVLAVITLMAPTVTALTLVAREGRRSVASLVRIVQTRLPEMGGETTLFMAAGVLSAGMAGMIAVLDIGMPFSHYGAFEASVTSGLILVAAWLGFHPVILGMVVGAWVAPLRPDPNLLAMTFLIPWAFGLPGCPMANTLLAIQARFRTPMRELLKNNRIFGLEMFVFCVAALYLYEWMASK
jgi:hypothetical protein